MSDLVQHGVPYLLHGRIGMVYEMPRHRNPLLPIRSGTIHFAERHYQAYYSSRLRVQVSFFYEAILLIGKTLILWPCSV